MKRLQLNPRSNVSGQGIVILIIFLAIIGGGWWWLSSHKKAMDQEGRAFGREMIQRLAVNHDLAYFSANLSPQARLDNPPSQQQAYITQLTGFGVPQQPIEIEETMSWEHTFFEPKGLFSAKLNYPAQQALLQISFDHPVGKWQLDTITLTWDRAR